jgi:radical SAM protein with 4Fe4S-binding SPASM domain
MSFYKFDKILGIKELNQPNNNGFRKLIHVRIEPTELCNFSCKFCVTQDSERLKIIKKDGYDGSNRKFNLDRILSLLDELKDVGVKAVSYVAVGDPLMYPNIDKVLKKSVNLNYDLGLTSNFAMNIKDDLIETLSKFSWLRWSMNGGSKEVYLRTNNPKGKNSQEAYENVKRNINNLSKVIKKNNSKTLINASYVVSEWNYQDVINAAALGKELNINNLFFRPDMMPMNSRIKTPLDIIKINQEILMQTKKYETDNFKIHIEDGRENDVLTVDDKNLVCFYSNHSIYIAANGDVYPCCYTRINKKFVVGNISQISFQEFWKAKNSCENYKNISTNTCPSCPYIGVNKSLKTIYENTHQKNNNTEFLDNFV